MDHHATNPRDGASHLESVIGDLCTEIKSLKAQIFGAAAKNEVGSVPGTANAVTGAQHAVCESQIDELMKLLQAREADLASSQRLSKVNGEALDRASKDCHELETQRLSAVDVMKNVVDLSQVSLDKGKKSTVQQKNAAFETALKEINAKGRDFLRAAKRTAQPEGQGPQRYGDLFNPASRSTQNVTAPAQTAPQFHSQHGTTQAGKAASGSDSKPAAGSKPTSTPSAGQQSAPQSATRSAPKPVSGNKATSTPSASRPPVTKPPAKVNNPPTSKVYTTPQAQGPPKPQASQGSKPAPSPDAQAGSEPNPRPATVHRTPANEAERFPPLATGSKPDLPSTRPEQLTMPNVSSSRPVLEDLDSMRKRLAREEAEGRRPVLSEEWEAKVASFRARRPNKSAQNKPRKEEKERLPFVVKYLDEKDAEHQDSMAWDDMEDLYDVSGDEAPTPRRAASAEGKRRHASNTDDEPPRKRARATVISPEARSIDVQQSQTPRKDYNCIIQVDDSEPYGSLNRRIFAHSVTVVIDSGNSANPYIGLRFNYMGSDGDEVAKMDWEIGPKVGGQWVVKEFNYVLVKDVPQDTASNHGYVLIACPEAALPRLMCITLVLTGQGQGYKRNDIGYASDSLRACLETVINPRETFTLRIWFLVPVQSPEINEKSLSVIRYLLGQRKEPFSGVLGANGMYLTGLMET